MINRFNAMLHASLDKTILAFEQIAEQLGEIQRERELAALWRPLCLSKTGWR